MAEIKDRIIEYLKINGITKQDFCKETGISYANMVGKSLKSELGGEQISSIFMKFPNINPDWLLLGKGEILRKSDEDPTHDVRGTIDVDHMQSLIDILNRTLSEKDKQISQLLEIIKNFSSSEANGK